MSTPSHTEIFKLVLDACITRFSTVVVVCVLCVCVYSSEHSILYNLMWLAAIGNVCRGLPWFLLCIGVI